MTVRVDCAGASRPPVCIILVEHCVVCLHDAVGLLLLPHHDFFSGARKEARGINLSHEQFHFPVLIFFPILGYCQFQGGF